MYNNREYELLWILWLCKLLKIKLSDNLLKKTKHIENPLLILILLNYYRNNSNLDVSEWQNHMIKEELYGEYWILAYEALKRGWLPSKNSDDYIKQDEFFKILDDKNIYFFNTNCREEWIGENIEEEWLPIFSPAF